MAIVAAWNPGKASPGFDHFGRARLQSEYGVVPWPIAELCRRRLPIGGEVEIVRPFTCLIEELRLFDARHAECAKTSRCKSDEIPHGAFRDEAEWIDGPFCGLVSLSPVN